MSYSIGIRREDLSKKGEERVAIVPALLQKISQAGHKCLIQPGIHPKTQENKRRFKDAEYISAGAEIRENIEAADLIFGLKEVELKHLLENKTYFMFSHTHKGQVKNRKLLKALIQKKCSLIDYELICFENRQRVLTAFTYFAGYAGMTDSLWTLSKRQDIFPLQSLKQSVGYENMEELYQNLDKLASQIAKEGTSASSPPLIVAFLGNGKTSAGAQTIFDRLPVKEIELKDLEKTFQQASRNFVYKLVLDIPEMYRLKAPYQQLNSKLTHQDLFNLYLQQPDQFESNMDKVFPYCTMWMNCIIWSEKYPRLLTRQQAQDWYSKKQVLKMIGDITCDPEGAIQFSAETWIDDPVFIFNPKTKENKSGFEGEGIAVMAVTNLPCEFPKDASIEFSKNFEPVLMPMLEANFSANRMESANLPSEIEAACILWKGKLTEKYKYMEEYT